MAALIIFIKNPEKGKVKARLALAIGEDAALHVYRQLLAHTRKVTQDFPGEKFLFYADYPNWNDDWDISLYRRRVQQGDNPNERIAAAFEAVFEEERDAALMIGSDCYELTPEIIAEAHEALKTHEVVVGPAHNGGYYLLGMNNLHPALFASIPRNMDSKPAQAMLLLQELGLSHHLLPALHVLRTAEDLLRSGLKYE